MTTLDAVAAPTSPTAAVALKVGRLLGELETYVCGQSDIIIDCAMAATSPDECSAEDALDAALCALDAQGSMRGAERHL